MKKIIFLISIFICTTANAYFNTLELCKSNGGRADIAGRTLYCCTIIGTESVSCPTNWTPNSSNICTRANGSATSDDKGYYTPTYGTCNTTTTAQWGRYTQAQRDEAVADGLTTLTRCIEFTTQGGVLIQ